MAASDWSPLAPRRRERPGFRGWLSSLWRQAIDGSMERMRRASLDALRMRRALLDTHSERLRALSPLGVLERGYALVRDADGAAITNAASLHSGQTVTVQMRDGRAEAVVGRITLEDE